MTTFLIFGFSFQKSNVEKHKNGHNSVILAQNEKIRPLSFLQLLKLKEIKWSYFFYLEVKWQSYGHFYVSQHVTSETKNQKSRKWPYLTHFSPKWKNKTTLFPSTLKVGEKKVVLFFNFELKWARYGWLFVFLKNSNRSYFWKLGPAQDHPKMFTKLKIFFSCASMTTSITRKSHGKIDFLIFPK